MKKFSVIIILLLSITACKKEVEEGPLPPPVKPVVYENVDEVKKAKTQELVKEIRSAEFKVAEAKIEDCNSLCKKVGDCLNSMEMHSIGSNCLQRCNIFNENTKSAISGNTDCKKVSFSYNKFNCEYSCDLIAKANGGKIPSELGGNLDMCLMECMKGIYEAANLFKAASCLFSKDSPDGVAVCRSIIENAKPIKELNDFLK